MSIIASSVSGLKNRKLAAALTVLVECFFFSCKSHSTITNVHPSVSQKAKHPESLKSSSFILHPFFVTFKLFSLFWVHFWYYLVNILNINIYSPKFGSFQKGAQIDSRYPIVCCCLYLCLYTCKYVQYILVYRVHYWWMIKILFLSLIKTSLKMETKPQVE